MAHIKEKPNGKFLVIWLEGGRGTKENSKTFATREEAEAKKHDVEAYKRMRKGFAKIDAGIDPFSGLTPEQEAERSALDYFSEHDGEMPEWYIPGSGGRPLAAYLEDMIASEDLRESTKLNYRQYARLYINDTPLGLTPIGNITPEIVKRWWADLPKGRGIRRSSLATLSKALNRAVLVGDLPTNPLHKCPEIRRPSGKREEEYTPLTVRQIEALAEAAGKPRQSRSGVSEMECARDRLGILVMAYGGLRAGELGGLREGDMVRDGTRCTLRIRRQAIWAEGGGSLTELKTEAARRTVAIPCSLADEIREFITRYGTATDGRIFRGPNGELRYASRTNHAVVRAGKAIGLDVNSHQLRHSAVSLLIDRGANPRAIQSFVGHTDIRMTLGTYGHLFDYGGQDLADKMEALRQEHREAV